MTNLPYSSWELKFALISLDEKKFTEEKTKDFEAVFAALADDLPSEKAELNKKIAQFQGVSVEQLINSPNYTIFEKEYVNVIVKKLINLLVEKFEITEKQAWALFVLGCDKDYLQE